MVDVDKKKEKKGGRMRTITFSSRDAEGSGHDTAYQKGVRRLEEAFGTRGGYVLGEGALNKNDALYMMEEMERKRLAEKQLQDQEAARFKHMVEREKQLKDVDDEDGGVDEMNGDEAGEADYGNLEDTVAKRAMGKKRRKTAKELLRVKKRTQEEENEAKEDARSEGGDNGGITALFGAYDDSD